MAAPLSSLKQVYESKLVQEISKRGDQVPTVFLEKDGFPQAIDGPPNLWTETLLIDFSLLASPSPASVVELGKLRDAFAEWGCIQVVNHGIESKFLEEMIQVSKQFFQLPLEEKLKNSLGSDNFQGYGNTLIYGDDLSGNWNDKLFLTVQPEEKRSLQFWPDKPDDFRKMVDEYSKKVTLMNEAILKAMAKSLNLSEDCFLNFQGKKGSMLAGFIMYPTCSCPERVLGVKPHTDGSTMSVLLAEKHVKGLQVKKNGQWYEVCIVPDTLFINLGDIGEVMTNGIFKSSVHRVVTNSTKDRFSVVAFCSSENEDEIEPVNELVSANQPQMYKKFSASEYRQLYLENFSLGRSVLDALKSKKEAC